MSKNRASKSTAKKEAKAVPTGAESRASAKIEMPTSEIRDLIDFIAKSGLNEVNIETRELKLHVKREPDQKIFKTSSPGPFAGSVLPVAAAPTTSLPASPATSPAAGSPTSGKKTVDIKSPMIGTFYRSSTPDTPPFVSVGDKITKGQTVCIIEAMKVMNEIKAETSGVIAEVVAENGKPVQFGQVLFRVR